MPEPAAPRPWPPAADEAPRRCPDDGRCHHECQGADCFRVRHCGPLSGVYPGDTWPAGLREIVLPGPETWVL